MRVLSTHLLQQDIIAGITEVAYFSKFVLCPALWSCQGDEYEDCKLGVNRQGSVVWSVHQSNCASRCSCSESAQKAVAQVSSDHDMRHGIGIDSKQFTAGC